MADIDEAAEAARRKITDTAEAAADELVSEASTLRAVVRHEARRIAGWVILFALIVIAGGAYSIRSNRHAIERIDDQRCATNRGEHELWEGLILFSRENPQESTLTPEQQAEQLRRFRLLLDKTFPIEGC